MNTISVVPLTAAAQTLTIGLGGVTYNLTLLYRDTPEGGWTLDIADANDVPILQGIPLVSGVDVLAQYGYLGFGGRLGVFNGNDPDSPLTYDNLGSDYQMLWVTP
jgi:hypothetical protein